MLSFRLFAPLALLVAPSFLTPVAAAQEAGADVWARVYGYVLDRDWTRADTALADFRRRYAAGPYAARAAFWSCYTTERLRGSAAAEPCYREQATSNAEPTWRDEARARLVLRASGTTAAAPSRVVSGVFDGRAFVIATPELAPVDTIWLADHGGSVRLPSGLVVESRGDGQAPAVRWGPGALAGVAGVGAGVAGTTVATCSGDGACTPIGGTGGSTVYWSGTWNGARRDTLTADERVAVAAVEALAQRGSDAVVADLQRIGTEHRSAAVREAALVAIGRVGTPAAMQALVGLARRDRALSTQTTLALTTALSRVRASDPALPDVLALLEGWARQPGLRVGAVGALGRIDAPEVAPVLERIAREGPDDDVRVAAVQALARREASAPFVASVARDARAPARLRGAAIQALGTMRAETGVRTLVDLAADVRLAPELLSSVTSSLAYAAARGADPSLVVPALERLARQPGLRVGAVGALGRVQGDLATAALDRLGSDASVDTEVRVASIGAMATRGDARVQERSVSLLERTLRLGDAAAARQAVQTLVRLQQQGVGSAADALARVADDTALAADVRAYAVESYGSRRDPSTVATLVRLARVADAEAVRTAAVRALARIDTPEAQRALVDLATGGR